MAFPVIAGTNSNFTIVDDTDHTVNLPASIVDGDLLIVALTLDGDGGAMTWPGGWTELLNILGGSNVPNLQVRFRRANGTEGASISVTSTNSEMNASVSYRITGHHTVTDPEEGNTLGESANPDSPSFNPTNWDTEDTLWIACYGWDGGRNHDAFPTNHPLSQVGVNGAVATGCGVAMSGRNLNAASDDPDAGTISSSDQWASSTLAIRPGAPVASNIFAVGQFGQPQPIGIKREMVPY